MRQPLSQPPRRVLHCLHRSQLGGAQRRAGWLAAPLAERGFATTVLFPQDSEQAYADWLETLGVPFVRLAFPYLRGLRQVGNNARFVASLPRVVRDFRRVLTERRIEVVHVYGVTNVQPAMAALHAGIPVLWNLNDLLTPRPFVRLVEPLLRHRLVHVAVVTEAIIDHYRLRHLAGWSVMPVGCQPATPRTDAASLRQRLGIPPNAPVIGCVANLVPLKGALDFLAVAERLLAADPRRHAVLAGGEFASQVDYARRVHQAAAASPVAGRLHLVGFQDDVASWLRSFDALVFPSHSDACPMLVIEAMEAGLPIVASPVGEVPRMIGDLGLPLCQPTDHDGLATAAAVLLALTPTARAELAARLRQRVAEHYSLDAMANHCADIYQELLAR